MAIGANLALEVGGELHRTLQPVERKALAAVANANSETGLYGAGNSMLVRNEERR